MLAASVNIAVPIGTSLVAIVAAVAAAYFKVQQGRATVTTADAEATAKLTAAAMEAAKAATDLAAAQLDRLGREISELRELHHACQVELIAMRERIARIEDRPTLTVEQVQAVAVPLTEYIDTLKAQNGETK